MLRCLVGNYAKSWDAIISQAEFAYNNSVNRTIKKTPFEAAYGLKPQHVLDLVPLPLGARVSDDGEAFADHIRRVHEEVKAALKTTMKFMRMRPIYIVVSRNLTRVICPCALEEGKGNRYRRFLVKWLGKPTSESTSITEDELMKIDSDMYDEVVKVFSPESIFPSQGD
uniref:Integrase catalytic domain-containing protein n=1 Tax=Ananas comosus var. bracteatus TaxID=296719 RepID=A0A6V7QV19_ANACO